MKTTLRPLTASPSVRTTLAAVSLASLVSLTLLGQGGSQAHWSDAEAVRPTEPFRHYPEGKSVPGLDTRAGSLEGSLAAAANRALPSGVRVRPGARSVVGAGASPLHRFALEYDGVPLSAESDYVLILHADGRLLASRARNLPESVDSTQPTLDPGAAAAIAADHARRTFALEGSLTVASPRLEVWVDPHGLGRLNWALVVRSMDAERQSIAYRIAAAGSSEVLEARDLRQYAVHAQGNIWKTSQTLPTVVVPFADLRLTPSIVTDLNGDAIVPPGTTVGGPLRGPLAVVSDALGAAFSKVFNTSTGNDTLTYDATTESQLAQTTAFYWTSRANRWVRTYLPSLNGSGTALDNLIVLVNGTSPCNAFTNGSSLTFGRSDAGCRNAASPTIIVHELGHLVDFVLGGGRFQNVDYSSGFADALSGFVTGDTCFGRDLLVNGPVCLRDLTAVTPYPVADPNSHTRGEPFAQFAWALGLELGIDTAARLILSAAAGVPDNIPDAVHLSFVVDDDDGWLATCSPHQRALQRAADSRALPRPSDCADIGTFLRSVTPNSPANNNLPSFSGTTAPNVPVGLFTNADCVGGAVATTTANSSGAFAMSLIVANNSTRTVYARALPTDGRTGACSAGLTYVEDSTPPPAPVLQSTSPTSPSSSRTPSISGSAPDAARVRIYRNACTGTPVVSVAVTAGVFSAQISVADSSTNSFVALAEDAAGNVSSCSAAIAYVHRPPSVSIGDASIFEGRVGQFPTLNFLVSLSDTAAGTVTVSFATSDGSGGASDYRSRTGTVSLAPGEKAKTVAITVVGDGSVEPDESITVRITATGAPVLRSTAQGTIKNDDNVGIATVSPTASIAQPRDVVRLEFGWVVPETKPDGRATNNSWRDLTTMTLRLTDERGHVAFEVVWIQESNVFQVRHASSKYGKPLVPGSGDVEESPFFTLDPRAIVVRTAPGPAVTVVLPLQVKPGAIGKTFRVEGAALDDFGEEQPFEVLGSLTVVPRL